MSRAKPKQNYTPGPMDCCQTPPYALDPLLPYVSKVVWEPAMGDGLMYNKLMEVCVNVIGTDLQSGFDFFKLTPTYGYSQIITNPPYSLKYKFIDRCYELGKPFALLIPGESIFTKSVLKHFPNYEIMCLTDRVNFKMPNKGYGGAAQFPVIWFCHNMLPDKMMVGDISKAKKDFENDQKNK